MQDPSLVIVPYRYKATKLYSEIPISGIGDFTVGRALNTATRVNSNGNIEVVNADVPRLDYYTTGGVAGCPALLVEPSSQNLGWHSQTWATGTTWTLTEVTTVTGTSGTLDPLGTNLANAISPTAVSGVHNFFSNTSPATIGYVSGTIYTASVFLKQGTGTAGRYAQLTYNAIPFTQAGYANFDLQLGTVAVVSGTIADTNRSASIENYGNGWYRCRFTATCNASINTVGCNVVLLSASGDIRRPSFAGVTGDILYGFGMQLETGSIATSYIPTTTAAVTRNADVISVSGAVSGVIGQSEGTIYAEVDLRAFASSAARRIVSIRVDGNNLLSLEVSAAGTSVDFVAASGGSSIVATASGITTGIYKIAVGYNSAASGTVLYVNGTLRDTRTISIPNLSAAVFGLGVRADGAAGTQFGDRIRAVALYNSRLDDADLMVLTSPTYYSNVRDMIWDTFVARPSTYSELPGCLQTRHNELITL